MNLFTIAHQVSLLEQVIRNLNFAMRHASQDTIHVLRKHRDDLENVYDSIMRADVSSNINLGYYIQKSQACIRDCVGATISGKPNTIPRPPAQTSYTLPDFSKVNLIFYIDSTESMHADLAEGGAVSNALQSMLRQVFWEIEMYQSTGMGYIDCIASLVWFGDASEGGDTAEPYIVDVNLGTISEIPTKLAAVKKISGGENLPESGLHAINQTFTTLVDSTYRTCVVYVSDAPTKVIEQGASASIVKALFTNASAVTFGLFPTEVEPDIRGMFTHYKDFSQTPYNLNDWVSKFFRT